MSGSQELSDLEIASLLSSKICHDVIGPVGAINIGLQLFEEEKEEEARQHAYDMIRNVTQQASICLEFARFAFGASGSAGSLIDLGMAEKISRNYVVQGKGKGKHTLVWKSPQGSMQKDKIKLLLNLIASSITALPRGGEIEVNVLGTLGIPSFLLICRGSAVRFPQYLSDFLNDTSPPVLDAMTIQAYYTKRLSNAAKMNITIGKEGSEIVIVAQPV